MGGRVGGCERKSHASLFKSRVRLRTLAGQAVRSRPLHQSAVAQQHTKCSSLLITAPPCKMLPALSPLTPAAWCFSPFTQHQCLLHAALLCCAVNLSTPPLLC